MCFFLLLIARFLENNIGEDGTTDQIMRDLYKAVTIGRDESKCFTRCLDLFASFCTKKETNSTLTLKTQMNLAGKVYEDCLKIVRKEVEGNLLSEKISSARMAFIYLQIINNMRIIEDTDDPEDNNKDTYEFKPKPQFLRFTSPEQRNLTGGWHKDGMTLYTTLIDREKNERKRYAENTFLESERTGRCDYFCPLEDNDSEEAGAMSDNEDLDKEIEYDDESLVIDNDEIDD